jgi:hypothetical protein
LVGAALPADLGFHDGFVPEDLPETGGYIDPYVVLWGGIGDNPFEPTACGTHSTDTLVWDFQTTVVAASASACRQAAQAVKASLVNLVVGTGKVRPNPDGYNQQSPILDTQTIPARFMLPLQWRITTN